MKKRKHIIIAVWILIISGIPSVHQAQEITEFNNQMNRIFQYVDKNKVSTGLLHDFGLHMIDPIYYDGTAMNDENYTDIDIWKSLYWGMYSSKVNSRVSLSTPDQINARIQNEASTSLAVMHLQYDIYRQDAVSAGLTSVVNEQIYDVSGKNPYEQKMLFVIAPKEKYYQEKTVSFRFNSNLFVHNTGKTVRSLQINFNNESGYRTVSWNSDVTHTFSSTGIKDIYFRVIYTDNTTYTCRTKISVADNVSLRSSDHITLNIDPTSQHSGGSMQILYADGNTTGKIRKPLIIAEGFDPSVVMGEENMDITNLSDTIYVIGSLNTGYPNIWENINSFDIVYLDYKNGLDDIRRNAILFQEVIDYVNNNKVGGHPNIVMGISMGGLVARYALRKMETENRDHDTWKFISVDSPHKGANVPIGFQAMLRHVADIKFSVAFINVFQVKNMDRVKKGLDLLNSKAAKQMLIYYVNDNLQFDNTEHTTFQTEYDNLGFPLRCENVTMTDGTGSGTKVMEPGTKIVDYTESRKLKWWVDLITAYYGQYFVYTNFPELIVLKLPGDANVEGDIEINAAPNRTTANVYRGKLQIKKKVLWLINVNMTISEKAFNSNTSVYPLDGAPGGIYDVGIIAGDLPSELLLRERFTFIPSVSALGLSDWQSQLNNTLNTQNLYNLGKTKFVRYHMPASNQQHTYFYHSASFLVNEINSIPADAIITGTVNITSNRQFNRNIIVKNGATLNISSGVTLDASTKNIIVEQGGKVIANSQSKIYCKNIDVAAGGNLTYATNAIYISQ